MPPRPRIHVRAATPNMTSPKAKGFQFLHKGILLDYRAVETKTSLSKLKGSYHLFLRNQPLKPEEIGMKRPQRLKAWKAPIVNY